MCELTNVTNGDLFGCCSLCSPANSNTLFTRNSSIDTESSEAPAERVPITNGNITMESTLSTSSDSDSDHMPQDRPYLACIRILKLHFDNGGLSQKGYDMLYRMVEMMSAIGWETHVVFCSKIPRGCSLSNMEWYARCILEGCKVFRRNMKLSVSKAMDATESLPDLENGRAALGSKLKLWECKLRTLHRPTGNDRRMFELMLNHYEDVAYHRLVQLNIRKPQYKLEDIVESIKSVYIALEELHHLAQQADELVLALDHRFQNAVRSLPNHTYEHKPDRSSRTEKQNAARKQVEQVPPATVYHPSQDNRVGGLELHVSKSFGVAEDEIVRRGHARAATFSATIYTTASPSAGLIPPKPEQQPRSSGLGIRRKGTNVPRIFTGSFSQLESDLRKLQLDKVETPITDNISDNDPVKIRDFATPALSPCTTQSSQPLQRREALVSRDIEFQDRLINGEVVKSRRPSNKARSQTIDDGNGGLEAWLKETPARGQIDAQGSTVRRGNLRHREKTI